MFLDYMNLLHRKVSFLIQTYLLFYAPSYVYLPITDTSFVSLMSFNLRRDIINNESGASSNYRLLCTDLSL